MTDLRFILIEDTVINLDELAIAYPVDDMFWVVMKSGHPVNLTKAGGMKLLEWFINYRGGKSSPATITEVNSAP